MKMNFAMRNLLKEFKLNHPLSPSLKNIADEGFFINEECHLLRALSNNLTNSKRESFPDFTGYECFVNSVHIEDYESENPLLQAILFVKQVFSAWNISTPDKLLIAIISVDEPYVVTKFHMKRSTEQWLSENIEGYDAPIMSIESSEDVNGAAPRI